MTIQQFIEKAIAGGWRPFYARRNAEWSVDYQKVHYIKGSHLHSTLLDPLAWQAVSKTEGWPERIDTPMKEMAGWEFYMHHMIDALVKGKTIEEFLATLGGEVTE